MLVPVMFLPPNLELHHLLHKSNIGAVFNINFTAFIPEGLNEPAQSLRNIQKQVSYTHILNREL